MAASLLDELPCLLEEADELKARLSFRLALLQEVAAAAGRGAPHRDNDKEDGDDGEENGDLGALRGALAGVDVPGLLRGFSKHFLAPPVVLSDRLQGLLPRPGTRPRRALEGLVAALFQLMKRVYHWQQTTWGTLTEFLTLRSPRPLTFDSHRLLTSLALKAITQSVKLHLLWTSSTHLPGALALHSFFLLHPGLDDGAAGNGPQTSEDLLSHPDFRLREFVLCFGTNPLIKLQQDLQQHPRSLDLSRNLLELTLSCFDCYVGCHDLAHVKELELDPRHQRGEYAGAAVFQDLLVRPQLVEWVIAVALLLPQHWRSETIRNASWQLWDFVQLVVEDRLVLLIARDQVANVHDLLYQQLQSAISGCQSPVSPALSSLKTALRKLSKRTILCAGDRRRERRCILVGHLTTFMRLLRHDGRLVAPLLPLLLALAALAREELEWLLAHSGRPEKVLLPSHVKSKHFQRAGLSYAVDASAICELTTLYHQFHHLLQSQAHVVRPYYTQFLAHGDADAIAFEIERCLQEDTGHSLDPRVSEMLKGFTDRRRFEILRQSPSPIALWRREWHQLSTHLLLSEHGLPASITRLLNRACRHVQYVESIEGTLLDRIMSFSKCMWHAELLERVFQDQLITTRAGSALGPYNVLRDLQDGDLAVEELVEAVTEGTQVLEVLEARVQRMITMLGTALEGATEELVRLELALDAKVSPMDILDCMASQRHRRRDGAAAAAASFSDAPPKSQSKARREAERAATTMLLLTPGMESRLMTTPDAAVETVLPLTHAKDRLFDLVLGIHRRLEDRPDEALAALVSRHARACLVRFLHSSVPVTSDQGRLPQGWGLMARHWRGLVSCLRRAFPNPTHVPIDEMVAAVCSAHGTGETSPAAMVTTITEGTPPVSPDGPLVDRITWFLLATLSRRGRPLLLASNKGSGPELMLLLGSATHRTFVDAWRVGSASGGVDGGGKAPTDVDATEYLSSRSLRELREILGASAIERVAETVVEYVGVHVKTLYACLERDKVALIRLRLAFPRDDGEIAMAIRIMEGLPQIIGECIDIGNGLMLLELLEAPSTRAADVVGVLRRRWGAPLAAHPQAIWGLLPWALVASLHHAPLWARTAFLPEWGTTTTNVHQMARAVGVLVRAFEPAASAVHGDPDLEDEQVDDQHQQQPRHHQQDRERLDRRHRLLEMVGLGVLRQLLARPHPSSRPDPPALAMVHAARAFAAGLDDDDPRTCEALDTWLPEALVDVVARGA